jgi:uncharacterized repeat protein (TIGR03803 family)
MVLSRRVVCGLVFFCLILASLPLFAAPKRGDVGSSQNGFFANCPPGSGGGVCPYVKARGNAVLTGTDMGGNSVTVTVHLYDWGYYPCTPKCTKPIANFSVLDVVLEGATTAQVESLVVRGVLPSPTYVTCGGLDGGLACITSPEPDAEYDVQEPTPIAGADTGSSINTRWDFGGIPPSNPPPPAVPFDQLQCISDDGPAGDQICTYYPNSLGEAILVAANSINQNKLGTTPNHYLVTLTDGTQLGTFVVPKSPTKQVVNTNNTQATATVITSSSYTDYTDASLAYPQINADGTEQYPEGFTPLPLSNPPPCNPSNEATGQTDTRTFRTAWYTYTAPSEGSITINTAGSRYDTLLYVFTGSASAPNVVSCVDDAQSGLLQAVTTFNASPGTTYQIMVGETPSPQTGQGDSLTGYPLSADSILYFNFEFSTAPPTTTTTVTSSPNPSIYGQTVAFAATVTSQRPGTPTGTITFSEGQTILGTASLSSGTATLSAVPLVIDSNSITASYSGDSNFNPSSGSMNQVVDQAKTTLTLSSSPNPSGLGQPVILTAVITPQYGGQASGTVTFFDGTTTLGVATVSGNTASLTTTALTLGTNSITATYNGDSNFTSSTSSALSQVVKYASTTTLVSSPNPSALGSPVTFTVAVTSSSGKPTGKVEILNGSLLVATLKLQSGSAKYMTSQLPVGSNIITAVYEGNANVDGSTSAPVNQVVVLPSIFSVLHSFVGGTDGAYPAASLVQDAQGNLYGTTVGGGTNNGGTVFKVDTMGNETVIHSFTGTAGDGQSPLAGLVLDTQGNLYGTTEQGGNFGFGTVFKVSTNGQVTILHSFPPNTQDGIYPVAALVMDTQGNLYGTTEYGGGTACDSGSGCGTVFEVSASGQETVLYRFTGTEGDGAFPLAPLLLDSQGNLYGTTAEGGNLTCNDGFGCGTVFEVSAAGQETSLYTFPGWPGDGEIPSAGLVWWDGSLAGTTTQGGTNGAGMVFVMDPYGLEFNSYSFTGTGGDGACPRAGLAEDAAGNLYGTTAEGGAGFGTMFTLSFYPTTETLLYTFTETTGVPQAGVVRDAQGNLYGTTGNGGADNEGTVFKLSPQ